jgi:hypothetical protein
MVGEKYEDKLLMLKELIRKGFGNILESEAENHACYFCRKRIEGRMVILTLGEKNGFSRYPIDKRCYKIFQLFEEYDGMLVSLN